MIRNVSICYIVIQKNCPLTAVAKSYYAIAKLIYIIAN